MSALAATHLVMSSELNQELARHIETERIMGRFSLTSGEILVLDERGDTLSWVLITALEELMQSSPDQGGGCFIDMDLGPVRYTFRILAGWDTPPTVTTMIGAGAVVLRYEGDSPR